MSFAGAGYAKDSPSVVGFLKPIFRHTNNYSYLELADNWYHDNFAENGGAVLYASDDSTINVTCNPGQGQPAAATFDCGNPMWTNNTVGKFGYGPLMAFPPAALQTTLLPSLLYVSNGGAKINMSIRAVDNHGSQVTRGWLRMPHSRTCQLLTSDAIFWQMHMSMAMYHASGCFLSP